MLQCKPARGNTPLNAHSDFKQDYNFTRNRDKSNELPKSLWLLVSAGRYGLLVVL